jgi:pimeloyl-ACP methyl ester carboxylesterase
LSCAAGLLAQNRLEEFTEQAKKMKPTELMLLPGWWYAITAGSFLDLANCPDILELAPKIRCPVLYLRGDKEPRDLYPAEEFAKKTDCKVEIVPDCDHFYNGCEEAVSGIISRWL